MLTLPHNCHKMAALAAKEADKFAITGVSCKILVIRKPSEGEV